jgi:hypothetical protein
MLTGWFMKPTLVDSQFDEQHSVSKNKLGLIDSVALALIRKRLL